MIFVELDNFEAVGWYTEYALGRIPVDDTKKTIAYGYVPRVERDSYDLLFRIPAPDWATEDYRQRGTFFTQVQIDALLAHYQEELDRRQKASDELANLIGLNVLSLTDAQRWKLVAAVFFKLGVINSSGIVQQYSEWETLDKIGDNNV